jgi:CheY-like chemotaxis protein
LALHGNPGVRSALFFLRRSHSARALLCDEAMSRSAADALKRTAATLEAAEKAARELRESSARIERLIRPVNGETSDGMQETMVEVESPEASRGESAAVRPRENATVEPLPRVPPTASTTTPEKLVKDTELCIKSILLIDDDLLLAETLKQLLEAHNFVVTVVHNGVEGICEVMKLDFDVILCDLMMPQMPGDMFYLAVQKAKPHLASRFIFITGHGKNQRLKTFLNQVNGLVLSKPASTQELIRAISLVITRTRSK